MVKQVVRSPSCQSVKIAKTSQRLVVTRRNAPVRRNLKRVRRSLLDPPVEETVVMMKVIHQATEMVGDRPEAEAEAEVVAVLPDLRTVMPQASQEAEDAALAVMTETKI